MADQNNPWNTTPAADSVAQSANAWGVSVTALIDGGGTDWLISMPASNVEYFNILDLFHRTLISSDSWITERADWAVIHLRPVFQGVYVPVDYILNGFQQLLPGMPAPAAIIIFVLITWQISGVGMGMTTLVSLTAVGIISAWLQTMVTLVLVSTILLFCIAIGLPLEIWLVRSLRAARIIRLLPGAMQTTSALVYLMSIAALFGIDDVPGVVMTIIFILSPTIRLTILGINQTPADLIEASHSFGAGPRQMLFKVRLPLMMPIITAGINQVPMLALSTVVIVSMIVVGGLGQTVLRGIGHLGMGPTIVGDIEIVILIIIFNHLAQAAGPGSRSRDNRHRCTTGPVGLLAHLFIK